MNSGFNRRAFLELSGASLLSQVSGKPSGGAVPLPGKTTFGESQTRSSRKPQNLILFMPDEMRADSLACYGNPVTRTPNFDRLAKEGTRFENCHVQFPVCGASRCSMLTGWPTSVRGHRSLYYFLRPEEPNMFRYLREAGYDVFWFGKNDALAAQSFYSSVTEWAPEAPWGQDLAPMQDLTPKSMSMLYGPSGDRRKTGDYALLQQAVARLERTQSDRPFCIFLPLLQPHPPYTIPADFYNMYSPAQVQPLAPPNLKRKPDFHAGIRERYGLTRLDDLTFRKIRAVYYGQVSYSDWLLGELMEALERTGRNKDTALFTLSDHGDYAGDYGLVEKWPSGLEDCLTNVPLIGRVPDANTGVVASEMVELYDIMQTCLELGGTRANHTHFSRSLLPQMHGEGGDAHRAAFAEGGYNAYEPQCFEPVDVGLGGGMYSGKKALQNERPETVSRSAMVRTRTHKLISRARGQSELYDCKADPQLLNNLYGDTSASRIQVELQTRLLNHFIDTTGIAPMDKDPRECPPFYPTRTDLPSAHWQRDLLDT